MQAKFVALPVVCVALLVSALVLVRTGGLGGSLGSFAHGSAHAAAPAAEAATVSAVVARNQPWQSRVQATGQVVAVQGADLSAEVSGIVERISFASGQDVAAGTELLRLRPNDDDARLAQLQAQAQLGASNLARDRKQFSAEAVSRATLDADQSNLAAEQAQVAAQRAVMDEKVVRAPFAGRLGIRLVDLGQYLTAGTPVVTLQALDPIYVDLSIQQQALGQVAVGQTVSVHVDAWPDRTFRARLVAINSRLDSTSRMATVRAELGNHDHALLPGMFANVEVEIGAPVLRLTLPQTAISFNPYGDFVYVLRHGAGGGFTAQSRVVTTGQVRGDQVAVLSGLSAGERVVSAGQLKLRNGAAVVVDNSVRMPDSPSPSVADE